MDELTRLREQRAAAIHAAEALVETAQREGRELTDEESAAVEGYLATAEECRVKIEALEARRAQSAQVRTAAESLRAAPRRRSPVDEPEATDPWTRTETRVEVLGPAARHYPDHGWLGQTHGEPRAEEIQQGLGAFAAAVRRAHVQQGVDERLIQQAAVSGMSQGTGADGGFLVPPLFSRTIWERMSGATGNLLERCDRYDIPGASYIDFPAIHETDRSGKSVAGGVKAYWLNEGKKMTGSQPVVRKIRLEPQPLGVLVYVTDTLLRNASTLGQFLERAAAGAIILNVSDAIVNGTGAGQPKGILASGGLVTVAKEGSQTAATIVTENLAKMRARLHPAATNAVWLMNQELMAQTPLLSVTGGTASSLVYMPAGGISGRPYETVWGLPVLYTEYCHAPGSKGDVILCDLSFYAAATQGGIESAASMHLRFDYNETAFRFVFYVDGQTWNDAALTPLHGSNSLSPFVTLAARG